MWIEKLSVENFRLFEKKAFSFHPQFNLLVGENGTGKTSLLNLLAVVISGWIGNICKLPAREYISFSESDLRTLVLEYSGELRDDRASFAKIHATWNGMPTLQGQPQTSSWKALYQQHGKYRKIRPQNLLSFLDKDFIALRESRVDFTMPLFAFYRCNRLWNSNAVKNGANAVREAMEVRYERSAGYIGWAYAYTDDKALMLWIQKLDIIAYQEKANPLGWQVMQTALRRCFEDFDWLHLRAMEGQLIIFFRDGRRLPFNQLSDGQRTLFAMIGDMVRRAVLLNPQLGDKVLEETPGVVLIDELDLHLHPKWQRRIIEDLRRTFPKIQFIATTHSPFLIQSLRSGEELIMLDGQPTAQLGNMGLEEIARGIMGVSRPEVSQRYEEMKTVAQNYLEMLELAANSPEEKLEAFKQELAKSIDPYADNPAFQAFLEMKRAAKLGE